VSLGLRGLAVPVNPGGRKLDVMISAWYHRTRSFIKEPRIAWPLGVFLAARLFLSSLGYVLWLTGMVPTTPDPVTRPYFGVPPVVDGSTGIFLGVWQRFDAIHYLRIATGGYSALDLFAFPPLYPWLVRLIGSLLSGNMLLGAMVVSNAAGLLLLVVLHDLITGDDLGLDVAGRSLVYLVAFPTAFFLLVPYTESLFMLLCVIALREARRERWAVASLAAFSAALTRLAGLTLVLVLAVEMLRCADWDPRRLGIRAAFVLSPAVGLGGFLAWHLWSGVPSITELQRMFWNRFPAFPWQGIVLTFQRLANGDALLVECFDIAVILLMVGLGIIVVKRLPLSYGVFFWANLLFNLSQVRFGQPLSGQARFCLTLFPAFIVLAELGRSPRWNRMILYPFVALWAFWAGQFILWGWVG
jgi:hypothetical protein